jgi:hypothetical protein
MSVREGPAERLLGNTRKKKVRLRVSRPCTHIDILDEDFGCYAMLLAQQYITVPRVSFVPTFVNLLFLSFLHLSFFRGTSFHLSFRDFFVENAWQFLYIERTKD